MSPIVLALAPFVIFPAIVFVFTSARVRRFAFVVASLAALAGSWLTQGPDNPAHLVALIAFGIAGGALLIEFAALLRTSVKGRRAAHG